MNIGIVEKNIKLVEQMLLDGNSAGQIAKKLGCTSTAIHLAIKRHGLVNSHKWNVDPNDLLKNRKDEVLHLFNNNHTLQQISVIIGFSRERIGAYLREIGVDTQKYARKYYFNEDYFETIDTKNKAYFLGWMFSDGQVNSKGRVRIDLQAEDGYILQSFADEVGYDGELGTVLPKSPKHKPQTGLCMSSQKMVSDLTRLGCVQQKSLILKFPTEGQVPHNLMPNFLRGMLEGDGSIVIRKTHYWTCITSTEDFCESLRQYILPFGITPSNFTRRFPDKPSGSLYFGKKVEAKAFLDHIYAGAELKLNRKYEKYLKICELAGTPPL